MKKAEPDVVVDRFTALKKAGAPTALIVAVTLLSTPGFYTAFFDDSAERKAEVAYQVLVKEVEHLREDDKALEMEIQRLHDEIGALRGMIMMSGVSRSVGAAATAPAPSVGRTGVVMPDGASAGSGVVLEPPSVLFKETTSSIIENRDGLPSVDALIE